MENKGRRKRWRMWAGLTVLFLSGLLIGFLAGGIAEKRLIARTLDAKPGEREQLIMKKLTSMLDLTDEQQIEIRKVVVESQVKLRGLWREHLPEMKKIYEQGYASIRKHLTPSQQKKYDAYIEKRKKRWTEQRSRHKDQGDT